MRTMELQIIPTSTHAHTHAAWSVGECVCARQREAPTEYYQRCALLMVMLCEVQSCSTQTPAAAALYSNGATRHRRTVSWFLLDSASHSFCLCLFFFHVSPSSPKSLSTAYTRGNPTFPLPRGSPLFTSQLYLPCMPWSPVY